MKTISANLQTHLDGTTTSLATIWRIIRTDAVEFYFTDHDQDIVYDGNTYLAENSYSRTAISNDSTLSVDNLNVEGIFDSADITEQDIRVGKFDYAEVRVSVINYTEPTDGVVKMRRGRFGEVTMTKQGIFRAELRGLTQDLQQNIGEIYQPECRADVGDSRCKVPINPDVRVDSTAYVVGDFIRVATTAGSGSAVYENRIYECTVAGTTAGSAPTYDTTVDNTTVDGTATFTTRQSWSRNAVVDVVTDNENFTLTVGFDESRAVDDWFNHGAVIFESGDNDGAVLEVRDWVQSTRAVTLFLSAPFTVAPGDVLRLYPGCDKRTATCIAKFAITGSTIFDAGNIKNYRGEPFIPGQDEMTRYPDAKSA